MGGVSSELWCMETWVYPFLPHHGPHQTFLQSAPLRTLSSSLHVCGADLGRIIRTLPSMGLHVK